jgi:hypothetical protein
MSEKKLSPIVMIYTSALEILTMPPLIAARLQRLRPNFKHLAVPGKME